MTTVKMIYEDTATGKFVEEFFEVSCITFSYIGCAFVIPGCENATLIPWDDMPGVMLSIR